MMAGSRFAVSGHPLPAVLVHVIDAGRWHPPADTDLLASVFADQPSDPHFYDRAEMIRQNRWFPRRSPLEAFSPDGADPGIAPSQAVLIGDLGAEMPIALDYRLDPAEPRVLYCTEHGWIEVAPNVTALLESLGIEAGPPNG